jgi:hypothetical protein
MLALLNLSIRDVAAMIHGSFLYTPVQSWSSCCAFKYWNFSVNEHIYYQDIQSLAVGCPDDGAMFQTQVTATNIDLD